MKKLEQKYNKHFVVVTLLMFAVAICGNAYVGTVTVNQFKTGEYELSVEVFAENVEEEAIVGMIIGALVGVYVASVLLPLIANQTAVLEGSEALDENEQTLVGTWPLFIILGVMFAIIGIAL